MSRKLNKHTLKHDEFATDVSKVYSYVTENPTKALVVFAAVVLVVAGILIGNYLIKSRNENARLQMALVYTLIDSGNYPEARDSVRTIIDNYGSTKEGYIARYLKAHIFYIYGEQDSAIEAYSAYLKLPKSKTDPDLVAAASMGIAACYEDKSHYDEAIAQYTKTYEQYPVFFRADEALLGIARVNDIKGELGAAKTRYEEFLQKFPQSPYFATAKVALSRIEVRLASGAPASAPQQPSGTPTSQPVTIPKS